MKNKRGITLIALVITIIILLILAGITITQLIGNGLFEKVQLAKEKSEQKQQEENESLGDYENKIGQYINGTRNENENNYSKEEQLIGTWIDGKNLYRKVYEVNSPSTGDSTQIIDTTDLNVDTPVNVYGVMITKEGATPLNICFNSDDIVATWFSGKSVSMRCQHLDRYNRPCKVIVEYTKK